MQFELDNIGYGSSRFNFTRILRGYNPEEVDRVLTAYDKQNYILIQQKSGLESENARLKKALSEFDGKLRKFAGSMKAVEDERVRDYKRILTIMSDAENTAEKTLSEARRIAEGIIHEANQTATQIRQETETNAVAAKEETERLIQTIKSIRCAASQHFDALEKTISGISGLFPAAIAPPEQASPQPDPTPAPEPHPEPPDSTDPYEAFLKRKGLELSE